MTRNADGSITVVQQPGPGNSLGLMKIDIPNPHAIYFHDTPSKAATRRVPANAGKRAKRVPAKPTDVILAAVKELRSCREILAGRATLLTPSEHTAADIARALEGLLGGRDRPRARPSWLDEFSWERAARDVLEALEEAAS